MCGSTTYALLNSDGEVRSANMSDNRLLQHRLLQMCDHPYLESITFLMNCPQFIMNPHKKGNKKRGRIKPDVKPPLVGFGIRVCGPYHYDYVVTLMSAFLRLVMLRWRTSRAFLQNQHDLNNPLLIKLT